MKRIAYLDMARGIGMILVVLGHMSFLDESLLQFITSFHMPMFLMISGMLLYVTKTGERSFGQIVKSKGRAILIPYFVFSFGAIALELVRGILKHLDLQEVLLRNTFQTLCLQGFSTFWFLPTLFLGEILFIKVRQSCKLRTTAFAGICLMVVMYGGSLMERRFYEAHAGILGYELFHDVLLTLIRAGFAAGFIFAGYFLAVLLEKRSATVADSVVGAVLLVVMAYVNSITGVIELRFLQIGNLPLYLLRSLCGGIGGILLCRGFQSLADTQPGKVLRFFGANSLIIMVTHLDYHVLNYSIKAAELVQRAIPGQALLVVSTLFFVFAIEAVLICIINRFFYNFLGRKTQK